MWKGLSVRVFLIILQQVVMQNFLLTSCCSDLQLAIDGHCYVRKNTISLMTILMVVQGYYYLNTATEFDA